MRHGTNSTNNFGGFALGILSHFFYFSCQILAFLLFYLILSQKFIDALRVPVRKYIITVLRE